MTTIHPTADVDPQAQLADDVEIGRNCVISGKVRIGAGTRLIGNVHIEGPAEIGCRNLVYPNVCLGFPGQIRGWKEDTPTAGIKIGDDNVLRESFTMHAPSGMDHPTTMGDDNYMMTYTHIGHDSVIGDRNTFANCACLAGHVVVEDQCTFGGLAAAHQFVRVGRLSMLGAGSISIRDTPPFMMIIDRSTATGPNLVGLRRSGFSAEEINDVRWAYRTMFRKGLNQTAMRELLLERADQGSKPIQEILAFLEKGRRGLPDGRRASQR
jgi:UDP-N-acetylglucosamine acyltransferase